MPSAWDPKQGVWEGGFRRSVVTRLAGSLARQQGVFRSKTTGHEPGRTARLYGAGHPMIGTVLMLFFGLPSITRSLYATYTSTLRSRS
jgi:hypothetical protein